MQPAPIKLALLVTIAGQSGMVVIEMTFADTGEATTVPVGLSLLV